MLILWFYAMFSFSAYKINFKNLNVKITIKFVTRTYTHGYLKKKKYYRDFKVTDTPQKDFSFFSFF